MACRLVGLSRSAYRRPLNADTVTDPDRALRDWLRAWAKSRRPLSSRNRSHRSFPHRITVPDAGARLRESGSGVNRRCATMTRMLMRHGKG